MKVKKCSLELYNVFIYKGKEKSIMDMDKLSGLGMELRKEGIYLTGPVIIHKNISSEISYEIWLPMNRMKNLENKTDGYFCDRVVYTDCLFTRAILEDANIENSSEKMESYLKQEGTAYSDIFYAIIPIPGGKVVDIYIPVQGETQDE